MKSYVNKSIPPKRFFHKQFFALNLNIKKLHNKKQVFKCFFLIFSDAEGTINKPNILKIAIKQQ